ncbi:5-formyltetrahydrofolate cyclo-ligase [Xylariales sp. PMI_506]|nr:5-formyltetrahydrofolate cyclo-ligase [Xylariales sp. PMI_506]
MVSSELEAHKSDVRARVWTELRKVAIPDSRFHFDFAEYITDFAGSAAATDLLVALPCYRDAAVLFVAPDNCLEDLRRRALRDGKRLLVTTYGIRRGFWLLDPAEMDLLRKGEGEGEDETQVIDEWKLAYAATLDGMERLGRPVPLRDLAAMASKSSSPASSTTTAGADGLQIPLMVTGTGAVNGQGIRFGKGHGYFDLEWALLHSIGAISPEATTTVAVVHDCQVLDEDLRPEVFDTVCDLVVTGTRVLRAEAAQKPRDGILWDMLRPGMLEDIPPLRELREMQEEGVVKA